MNGINFLIAGLSEGRFIQGEIEKEFSRILKNVEFLVENGTFSFDRLNARLGKTQLYTLEQAGFNAILGTIKYIVVVIFSISQKV